LIDAPQNLVKKSIDDILDLARIMEGEENGKKVFLSTS
jgi:hypothetical protein